MWRQAVEQKERGHALERATRQPEHRGPARAHHAQSRFNSLERGDVAEALNAARQIGDDTLQRNAGRVPQPHTFAHGTADQRKRWFQTGYDDGIIAYCDTFSARSL